MRILSTVPPIDVARLPHRSTLARTDPATARGHDANVQRRLSSRHARSEHPPLPAPLPTGTPIGRTVGGARPCPPRHHPWRHRAIPSCPDPRRRPGRGDDPRRHRPHRLRRRQLVRRHRQPVRPGPAGRAAGRHADRRPAERVPQGRQVHRLRQRPADRRGRQARPEGGVRRHRLLRAAVARSTTASSTSAAPRSPSPRRGRRPSTSATATTSATSAWTSRPVRRSPASTSSPASGSWSCRAPSRTTTPPARSSNPVRVPDYNGAINQLKAGTADAWIAPAEIGEKSAADSNGQDHRGGQAAQPGTDRVRRGQGQRQAARGAEQGPRRGHRRRHLEPVAGAVLPGPAGPGGLQAGQRHGAGAGRVGRAVRRRAVAVGAVRRRASAAS